MQDILGARLPGLLAFWFINILLVGEAGAGKSSLINTTHAIFHPRGTVSYIQRQGSDLDLDQVTREFKQIKFDLLKTDVERLQAKRHLDIPDTMRVRDSTMSVSRALQTGHSLQLPMTLADTMGWWAAGVADAMRVDDMLDGTMMSGHPLEQVFRRDPKFTRREPAPVHGAHVIILAVPARTALNDDNLMMVIDMVKKANGLPCYVALTRVDELDTNLRVNPHRLRESADINQCIDAFARATGVPRQHIFPVQLYGENTSVEVGDPRIEVPVLRLLWQAITGATDRLSQLYDNGLALDEDARRGMAEMGACGADNRDVDAASCKTR